MAGLLDFLTGGKPPKPPDPVKTADAQYGYTQQAAGDTLKNNAMDRFGPFGSSEFARDPSTGLPTGITSQFSGPMAGGVNNIAGSFTGQSGLLPNGIDFSGINTNDILNAGMNAYDAYANPAIDRQLNEERTRLSERGLPDNSNNGGQIAKNEYGDIYDAANRARTGYFGQLYGQLPGMASTMTNTAIAQGMAPGQLTGQSLGLLSGAGSLLPQAQQPQANYAPPNYAGLVSQNYDDQMKAYTSNQAGLGNLLKTGASLLAAPMTGGTSLFGLGMGKLGDMWNSSSLNPASGFSP
jgi:hypothetical protein